MTSRNVNIHSRVKDSCLYMTHRMDMCLLQRESMDVTP